jgi:hypothetical protein
MTDQRTEKEKWAAWVRYCRYRSPSTEPFRLRPDPPRDPNRPPADHSNDPGQRLTLLRLLDRC